MKSNWQYYLSRVVVVALISLIFAWSGAPLWMVALTFIITAGFFIWAPLSGRYRVTDEQSATPFRLDERARQARNRAGRAAFMVVETLALALFIYGQFLDPPLIPAGAVGALLGFGMGCYLVLILYYERSSFQE
jgi:hypothetical protein